MRRLALAVLAFGLLRADMFPDASNAKLPEAQRNLGQMASITPQMYGAKGDGVADDTAAVQAWLNDLKTGQFFGQCQGKFRLTASVNAYPSKPYRVIGAGYAQASGAVTQLGGCNFYIDYNSQWAGNAVDLTNPVSPSDSNRGVGADWSSVSFSYNGALTSPPRAFGGDYLSDDLFRDITITQYTVNRGTCISFYRPWNFRQFNNVSLWGCGGHISSHLVPAGTTFSIIYNTTSLTSSASFFSAADVGAAITCKGPTPFFQETWRITGYVSPTQVTVGRAASETHTAQTCAISGITGSITAASNTLTINVPGLTANDVGRVVYIPHAGITALNQAIDALRTTITGVSGTTVTLADAASNTATDVSVIMSPTMEIVQTNDFVANQLNIEQTSGTQLVIQDSGLIRLYGTKLHGYNNNANFGQTHNETDYNMAIFSSSPIIDGSDMEATVVSGVGRVLIEGVTHGLHIGTVSGIIAVGLPQYALRANHYNSGFSFGPMITRTRTDQLWATPENLVSNDGTSIAGALTFGPVLAPQTTILSSFRAWDAVATGAKATTAQFTTSSGTFAAVGLPVWLAANRSYVCAGHLNGTADAARGIKVQLGTGSGLVIASLRMTGLLWNGVAPLSQLTATAIANPLAATTAAYTDLWVRGTVVTGNAPGSLGLFAAQNAAGAPATTVEAGSDFACQRMN